MDTFLKYYLFCFKNQHKIKKKKQFFCKKKSNNKKLKFYFCSTKIKVTNEKKLNNRK